MSEELPDDIRNAFERNDAVEREGNEFTVTSTVFDAVVSVDTTGEKDRYRVDVEVPSLQRATADEVGPTVATDWFETFERRLGDAPQATRKTVDLASLEVTAEDGTVTVTYHFDWRNPRTGVDIAKTFVEYVEGTYVEGVVPGYEYRGRVADLLSEASQGGNGGTPL